MAGRVDKIQHIVFPVMGAVNALHSLVFNGDTTLFFQIHGVQDLFLHFPLGQCAGHFNQPVCQRRLTVINMGNDRKITNMILLHMIYAAYAVPFCSS